MSNEVLGFELRRQSDDLVYSFARATRPDGSIGFKRADGDYWIVWKPDWGWVAWDEPSQSCMGRPWNVLARDQGAAPPQGDWVSRKGTRSYVYSLVHLRRGNDLPACAPTSCAATDAPDDCA